MYNEYYFFIIGDNKVSLPIQIPCIINVFHNVILRTYKIPLVELEFTETQSFIIENNITFWSANVSFNGLHYSVPFNYSSKKVAKFSLISSILKEMDPIAYSNYLIKTNETIQKLNEMKKNVLISNNDNISFDDTVIDNLELFSELEDDMEDNNDSDESSFSNSITDSEYLLYVSDNDIESYLKGCYLLLFKNKIRQFTNN